MFEPSQKPAEIDAADDLERDVDEAIVLCDGDVRAALRAALAYNSFLERKLDIMRGMISAGYTRGRATPARATSAKLDEWREISSGEDEKKE